MTKQKVKLYLRLSISVGILGILFKVMHWPYGSALLILGATGITIFYSVRFYLKKPRTLLDYSKLILLISFLFHYLFRVLHLQYGYVFTLLTQVAFVVFLILYARDVFVSKQEEYESKDQPKSKPRNKAISYLLYGIAAIGIILGAQFKILHWEFGWLNGNILLTIGLLAAIASFFVDTAENEVED